MKLNLGKKRTQFQELQRYRRTETNGMSIKDIPSAQWKNRGATGKKEPLKVTFPLLWVLITQQKVGKHGGKKIH